LNRSALSKNHPLRRSGSIVKRREKVYELSVLCSLFAQIQIGGRGSEQMANKISIPLPGFLVGGFSQSHPRLLKMFLGLMLLPGCSLLQQPSDLAVPAETRATIAVHDPAAGVGPGREVAARVVTTNPAGVVVERPVYFRYGAGITGGHTTAGFAP
jgi:hypothetical protein